VTRIGFVLGGGGLTGTAFHAGVLATFAQELDVDARDAEIIVGTSAGSTAAALIRAGFPPHDYVRRMTGDSLSSEAQRVMEQMGPVPQPPKRGKWERRPASPDLLRAMARRPWEFRIGAAVSAALPAGTVPVAAVSPGFGSLFHQWPQKTMWISAVSLTSGRRVLFGKDARTTVANAVSASCAIPGYFQPVTIDGEQFVDGGMHSTHHLDTLAGLGLDLVIVSAPLSTTDWFATEPGNVPRMVIRRQLAKEVAKVEKGGTRVVVVAPDAALRAVMGTNTMVIEKRAPVALATQESVLRRIRTGLLP